MEEEYKLERHADVVAFVNLSDDVTIRNNNSEPATSGETSPAQHVVGVVLAVFTLITIFGNILVMIAVGREHYLRSVTNYFIVSLSIADLIIGSIVMPFNISLELTGQVWLFGRDWCDVWHSLDVLATTASILNLSIISLDRYWAITDPMAYPSKMTYSRACILITLVWICSAAISFPAILWWRNVGPAKLPPTACVFPEDTSYLLVSSAVSFYAPVLIISYAYYKIYRAAVRQRRSWESGCKTMQADGENSEVTLRIHKGGYTGVQFTRAHDLQRSNDLQPDGSPVHLLREEDAELSPRLGSRKHRHLQLSKKLSKLAKEQKAAKTLGIVMGVFCICWVPFFVTNVLYAICNVNCVPHASTVFPIFTWLGYLNSGMNPIIYACSMRDFRRAFGRIIFCCCSTQYQILLRKEKFAAQGNNHYAMEQHRLRQME